MPLGSVLVGIRSFLDSDQSMPACWRQVIMPRRPTSGSVNQTRSGPAASWRLEPIDGGTISNQDLVGRPYLVNFWASWCPPCRREHPNLEAFYDRYRPQGVELLGVIFDDTSEGARAYRRELGGDWPLLEDADDRTAVDFGVTAPPETFVVDDAGIIVRAIRGPVEADHLREIEALFTQLGLR